MTVRAICTATFFFKHPESKEFKIANMLEMVQLPDWVKETNTWKINVANGRIKGMGTTDETKKVEKVQEETQDLTARQKAEQLEKEIAKMKKSELQEYCKAHNIEYKADATNPELIDLIKSTIK